MTSKKLAWIHINRITFTEQPKELALRLEKKTDVNFVLIYGKEIIGIEVVVGYIG